CHWVYLHSDDEDVYVMYGTTSAKLAEALLAQPPSDVPIEISDFSVLLGCIITKKTITDPAFTAIQMVTDVFFTGTAAADHGELSGLDGDDHPQYVLITDLEDTPTENEADKTATSEWSFDHDAASAGVHGAGANTILYSDHTADPDAHGDAVITADTNSATADDKNFSIVGGEGISTSGATTVVTITCEDASTTNKGVVLLDDTAGGTDTEVAKPPTSNAFFDHGANTTTAHGAVSAATASKIV
ncbi:unnamed protein product, partial [marine sediment metagenome]